MPPPAHQPYPSRFRPRDARNANHPLPRPLRHRRPRERPWGRLRRHPLPRYRRRRPCLSPRTGRGPDHLRQDPKRDRLASRLPAKRTETEMGLGQRRRSFPAAAATTTTEPTNAGRSNADAGFPFPAGQHKRQLATPGAAHNDGQGPIARDRESAVEQGGFLGAEASVSELLGAAAELAVQSILRRFRTHSTTNIDSLSDSQYNQHQTTDHSSDIHTRQASGSGSQLRFVICMSIHAQGPHIKARR